MFKAVIFDFDGTLVDSEWAYALTDIEFVKALGGDSSHLDHTEFIGGGVRFFVELFMEKLNVKNRSLEELIELNDKLFLDIAGDDIEVFPKMMSLVKDLDHRGIPMAIASGSSPWILDAISNRTGIDKHIDHIYSSQLVAHEKPSPDIYLYAAEKLGVKPEECLVFEDSEIGVKSAVRAGMKVVWFDEVGSKKTDLKKLCYKYYNDGQETFDYREFFDLVTH